MLSVMDVLDMAGGAVRLIWRNDYPIRAGLNFAVMASAAGGARRDTVDRIE